MRSTMEDVTALLTFVTGRQSEERDRALENNAHCCVLPDYRSIRDIEETLWNLSDWLPNI
jgi:hypothetical protein